MSAAMSAIRRSTTGCWTCRARRKKCDENGQPCDICKTLRLTCYGYGSRPDWMDGGSREQAQMATFKSIVKRTKRSSYKRASRSASQAVDVPDLVGSSQSASSVDESLFSYEQDAGFDLEDTIAWLDPISDIQSYYLEIPGLDVNLEQGQKIIPLPSPQPVRQRMVDSITVMESEARYHQPEDSASQIAALVQSWGSPSSNVVSQQGVLPSPLETPTLALATGILGTEQAFVEPIFPHQPLLDTTSIDDEAWHHYTDVMLPAMFPFLSNEAARSKCREALANCQASASCLRQVRYQVESSQASEMRHLGMGRTASATSTPDDLGYTMVQGFGVFNQQCLFHTLLNQVISGGKEWPSITQWLSRNCEALDKPHESSHLDKCFLAYIEVLASTVTGTQPRLAAQYVDFALQSSAARTTTGLEPRLLDCLIQIIELRNWKSDQLSKGSLSISKLMKSSLTIEAELEATSATASGTSGPAVFMRVFKSAASVFLQCVVSEPRPEIVEIQQDVGRTIDALRDLPQATYLKRLAWPICISASMAIKSDHQVFFRALYERIEQAWGTEENVCRALKAAVECWRLRASSPLARLYDWIDGMKSLGSLWLLF